MNTLYFLRHGETIKDPLVLTIEWQLAPEASTILTTLAQAEMTTEIRHIYTSTETKAQKSAEPFAMKLQIPINSVAGLEEMHRSNTFLSDEQFLQIKKEKLENRDSNSDNGETANEALKRFVNTVNQIQNLHDDEHIMIVSHGTVLALYFAYLKNDYTNIFDYWQKIPFCGLGIVKGNKVIKDFR